MLPKDFKKIFCVIVLFELAVVAALADAPVEQYHVIHDDIANGVMVDTLVAKQSSYDFADVFHFTQNGKRKLYQQPDQNVAFAIISKNARQFRWLKIIDQKAGFIQVGTIRYLNDQPKVDPIGWIRIRDDEKRLMLWIVSADNC